MSGLVWKDLYNIRYHGKVVLLMLFFFAFIFIPQGSMTMYLSVCMLTCSTMVITTISLDGFTAWDPYALTMPVSRREIILSKYIILVLFTVIGVAIGFLITLIMALVTHTVLDTGVAMEIILSISASLIIGSIMIPLVYRFGAEKARMFMILCFLLPTICMTIGKTAFHQVESPENFIRIIEMILWTLPLWAIAGFFISMWVCICIYQRKEW